MLLAIDGGGTKTHVLVTEDDGTVVCDAKDGPLSFAVVSPEKALENLLSAIQQAKQKINEPNAVFTKCLIGLAGVDSPKEVTEANEFFSKMLGAIIQKNVTVVNDSEIALASGSDSLNAMVIIAGTGSNCVGHNDVGQAAKAGGLEFFLSDEGSGFYIGHQALVTAVRSGDGRGEKTLLEALVKQHYEIEEFYELKEKVWKNNFNKGQVAHLALLVTQAASEDDPVAIRILESAAYELVRMVEAVGVRLGFEEKGFDLVQVGSVFTNRVIDNEAFNARIYQRFPNVSIIQPNDPPVYGALKLLLRSTEQHY